MRGPLSNIPRNDRAAVWAGFWLLLAVVASHALLETTRDALFLRDLPATDLPWAYLAIAVLCVLAAGFHRRMRAFNSSNRTLIVTLLLGAGVTAGLWFATERPGTTSLFAVYVWTGVLATVVVVQIWLRLGAVLDVVSAKSGFAFAGAGGMAGAALGSWLAALLLSHYQPRVLLLAAAAGLCIAAAIAKKLTGDRPNESTATEQEAPIATVFEFVSEARRDPYIVRLLSMAALAPIPLTLTDYLFKAAVAENIAAPELGLFFAKFYGITNTVALVFQLLLVPRILARIGAVRSCAIFPLLLAGTAGGAVFGGLMAIVIMKGTDASLRHSLNRAGTEILFLPLTPAQRPTAKFIAEAAGQRGGQAIASVLLMAALAFGATPPLIAMAIALLSVAWIAGFLSMRGHYVDRFRSKIETLRDVDGSTSAPTLELDSLETLIAALSSQRDEEVIAALDILHSYERARLIPGLILYHPSPAVVIRAIDILSDEERSDTAELFERLLDHADENVRARAVQHQFCDTPKERLKEMTRSDPSALVRATAIISWLARLPAREETRTKRLHEFIEGNDIEAQRAVARAVSSLPDAMAVRIASRLSSSPDRKMRTELAESIADKPIPELLPVLTSLLTTRDARFAARQAFLKIGDEALQYLAKEFRRPDVDKAIRRHIPRSISRFGNQAALDILVEALQSDVDSSVRYKILRGLGRLRADNPTLPIEVAPLQREAEESLQRAITILSYRVALQRAWAIVGQPASTVAELLLPLLAEKEEAALERIFRILRIINPGERFDAIFDGLRSNNRELRAGSLEMLTHIVEGDLRDGIVAVTSFGDDDERLEKAVDHFEPPLSQRALGLSTENGTELDPKAREYARDLLDRLRQELATDGDPVLRSIAVLALTEVEAPKAATA